MSIKEILSKQKLPDIFEKDCLILEVLFRRYQTWFGLEKESKDKAKVNRTVLLENSKDTRKTNLGGKLHSMVRSVEGSKMKLVLR